MNNILKAFTTKTPRHQETIIVVLNKKIFHFLTWCLGASWFLLPLAAGQWVVVQMAFADQPMMDADILMMSRTSAGLLVQSGDFEKGAEAEEKALKITEDQYGPLHPSVVPILNDLATFQRCEAKYAESERNYKWGLAIREKGLGQNHPDVAESLDDLAGLCVDLGRYQEAELDYQRAFEIQESHLDKNSMELANTLEGLGNLDVLMDKGKEAAEALNRCLQIREKTWGKDDLKLIPTFEELAAAFAVAGDNNSAESLLQKTLSLRQKALAPDRLEIADSLEKLAQFYRLRGQKEKAQPLWEQVAQSRSRFLSNNDFTAIPTLYSAALADFALDKFKESESLLIRVLKLIKASYGKNHPKAAFCLEDLASVKAAQGQKSKAVADLKEAKGILMKKLGTDHPEVKRVKKKLEGLKD